MKDELIQFLDVINREFEGNLIESPLDIYVQKLINHAEIFCHYRKGILIAMIAYYANNISKKKAFLSIIGVAKEHRSEGIGLNLIKNVILNLQKQKFKNFQLEVLKNNQTAIDIYNGLGFKLIEEKENKILMDLSL